MDDVLFVSIIHTGTIFLRKYLNSINVFPQRKHLQVGGEAENLLLHKRLLVPLRDPAQQLISCRKRGQSILGRAESWRTLALVPEDRVCFVPVDILNLDRLNLLIDVLNFLGVRRDPVVMEVTRDWANRWPVINSHGTSALNTAYEEARLQLEDPELWQELKSLVCLGPWLRRRGYPMLSWESCDG